MNIDIEHIASSIAFEAVPLYPKSAEDVNKYEENRAFTMYSYERFSSLIIQGIAQEMLSQGRSVDDVKWVLQSKHIRWGLDSMEDQFIELGKEFARKQGFKELVCK
jgi:hypothetical protein